MRKRSMRIKPYWNEQISELSNNLWLPVNINFDSSTRVANGSWFNLHEIKSNNLEILSIFNCHTKLEYSDISVTRIYTKKIRLYPTTNQKNIIQFWLEGSRKCYNDTIELLQDPEIKASWKSIKTNIIHGIPNRLKSIPYQIKSIAVRDACIAISMAKKNNKALKLAKERGYKLDQNYSKVSWRRKKNKKQSCYIPGPRITNKGIYHTILGELHMAEELPEIIKDSRLVYNNYEYYLVVYTPAVLNLSETQARVVAVDPGVRSFLAWYSETSCGKIAQGDFGKIQSLCYHLDRLIRKANKAKYKHKWNIQRAVAKIRIKIKNLVSELHHKAASYLVNNFDIILIPEFKSSEMVQRGKRRLNSKTARNMLNYAHYQFREFLMWKAFETGKQVLLVNESYTSKTVSWTGDIDNKINNKKLIKDNLGRFMDRDINGARGIFLRALGDHPFLRNLLTTQVATKLNLIN